MKEALALGWHVGDAALDLFNAPKKVRVGLALVGLVWSIYWFLDSREPEMIETDMNRRVRNYHKANALK